VVVFAKPGELKGEPESESLGSLPVLAMHLHLDGGARVMPAAPGMAAFVCKTTQVSVCIDMFDKCSDHFLTILFFLSSGDRPKAPATPSQC
jgi:hypothetical protein